MKIDIRPITSEESRPFSTAIARGFGEDPRDEDHDRFYQTLPLDRTIAAFDGDEIVGTLGEFDFDVTVPGGAAVPMAGTTIVTVRPTHRRRGILRGMMEMHLDVVAARGDFLAGLWASESAIYGRFGFGLATDGHEIDIDSRRVTVPGGPEDVSVHLIEGDEASRIIPAVYDNARVTRAGFLSRSEIWWEHRRFYDPEHYREGGSARRYAVTRRDGVTTGYVMFRQKEKWEDWIPDGTISVIEVVALDEGARRALWSFLLSIDLFPHVNWWNAPIDEPVIWEASNRRMIRRRIRDTLWLRILDVPAALAARRYEIDGEMILEVIDVDRPGIGGRFALRIDGGAASVDRTDATAAVSLDIAQLGALYLGGRNAVEMARADLIGGPAPDVQRLDRLFRTSQPPWCPEVF